MTPRGAAAHPGAATAGALAAVGPRANWHRQGASGLLQDRGRRKFRARGRGRGFLSTSPSPSRPSSPAHCQQQLGPAWPPRGPPILASLAPQPVWARPTPNRGRVDTTMGVLPLWDPQELRNFLEEEGVYRGANTRCLPACRDCRDYRGRGRGRGKGTRRAVLRLRLRPPHTWQRRQRRPRLPQPRPRQPRLRHTTCLPPLPLPRARCTESPAPEGLAPLLGLLSLGHHQVQRTWPWPESGVCQLVGQEHRRFLGWGQGPLLVVQAGPC